MKNKNQQRKAIKSQIKTVQKELAPLLILQENGSDNDEGVGVAVDELHQKQDQLGAWLIWTNEDITNGTDEMVLPLSEIQSV